MKVLARTYKDSTDYLGNLILRNAHPSQYLFDGGYASFDADTLDGWHYYVQDYMGNNRMVVNLEGTVEQENHYYPYGGVIGDLSTNENLQAYKFENKELDRTFGLDWYDIQARQYDAIGVPGWNAVDPLAEKYYGISPYSYCAGNPVNLTDRDGQDMCILLEPSAAFGHGHIAVLIQHKDGKYYLYSKNGAFLSKSQNTPLPYGPPIKNNEGGNYDSVENGFDSPQDFMDSETNRNENGSIKYTTGAILKCSETADEDAVNAANDELKKNYWLLGNNCAKTVQKALQATGEQELKDCGGEPKAKYIKRKSPNTIFEYIIEKYKQITNEDSPIITPSKQDNQDENK